MRRFREKLERRRFLRRLADSRKRYAAQRQRRVEGQDEPPTRELAEAHRG